MLVSWSVLRRINNDGLGIRNNNICGNLFRRISWLMLLQDSLIYIRDPSEMYQIADYCHSNES